MVPDWLIGIARLTPLLVIFSIVMVIFGWFRLRSYMKRQEEEREEEDRKRKEFLANLKFTPPKQK